MRILVLLLAGGLVPALGQGPVSRVEAGLEGAVKWRWWVVASVEKDWGFPVRADGDASGADAWMPPQPSFSVVAGDYEVKRGDALEKISNRSGVTVDQLKRFNELTGDLILIGQVLKIPTLKEVLAMAPPPPPVAKVVAEVAEESRGGEAPPALPQINTLEQLIAEATLHQVLLDREDFGIGPIDGDRGAMYEETLEIYQGIHEDLRSPEALRQKAVEVVGQPFASYRLKRSDFRFIEAPKESGSPLGPTYEELSAAEFLAYRTAWEFVAERFHCDEAFLRNLNPKVPEVTPEGIEFKVPNVIPFEVENCFAESMQPAVDPGKPVVATMVGVTRLEIRRNGELVAVMPVSRARPGLYGKGTWTILGATPGPRLSTRKESTSAAVPNGSGGSPVAECYLAAGPRNPVGVCWIDLAKSDSTVPLAYGLHGTSIPGRVKAQESIGGFRLANWDIARAVRMLPKGTVLEWK